MAFKANVPNRLLALAMGAVGALVGTTELRAQNLPQFIPPSVTSDNGNTEVVLSADGSAVVGLSFSDVNGGSPDAAWRWKAGTGTVALGAVPGFDSLNFSTGTSSDGSVVVGTGSGSSGVQGFLWTPGGGIAPLGLASGDVGNMALAVSADGSTVVGTHWSNSAAGGFYWTQGGGFVNIGTLPGYNGASAYAVSRNGSVIVGASSGPFEQAFMWTAGGGMVGLGMLAGDTGSAAYAVSSDGTTVVGISYSATATHAFRWTAATGMVDLGLPKSGFTAAVAYATNQDGSVVVGQLSGGTLGNAAFIWTAAGGIQLFQDYWLINGGIINNGSVSFDTLTGVSDNGKIFLGDGIDPSSFPSVFVANTQPSPLLAAVLPASRSAKIGSPVTAFATVINTGTAPGSDCGIALEYGALQLEGVQGAFVYQTTNPATNAVTGTANSPFNVSASNGSQSLVIAFTPKDFFSPVNMPFSFACDTLAPAPVVTGLDTLLVSASLNATPDVIALGATAQNDGIVHVTGAPMQGAFAVATDNLGSSSTITVATNTGTATLPITITVCQTNAAGACMQTPAATVATTIGSNATPTFGIFVSASSTVGFDPTNNRIFVTFTDSTNTVRGGTSVAVETQ